MCLLFKTIFLSISRCVSLTHFIASVWTLGHQETPGFCIDNKFIVVIFPSLINHELGWVFFIPPLFSPDRFYVWCHIIDPKLILELVWICVYLRVDAYNILKLNLQTEKGDTAEYLSPDRCWSSNIHRQLISDLILVLLTGSSVPLCVIVSKTISRTNVMYKPWPCPRNKRHCVKCPSCWKPFSLVA